MRRIAAAASALLIALAGLAVGGTTAPAPAGAAPACADVHVLFARGTAEEAPPLGITGIAFGNSVRNRLPRQSVRVEAVAYAASADFEHRVAFAESFVAGMRAAQQRVTSIAAHCPDTRIVLGGYSQGAALIAYTINAGYDLPQQYQQYRRYLPDPLPAEIAPHVAAVVEFGPPSARFLRQAGVPPLEAQAAYRGKTVRYCVTGDTICNGAPIDIPNPLHLLYSVNGMTDQAADFVARRL